MILQLKKLNVLDSDRIKNFNNQIHNKCENFKSLILNKILDPNIKIDSFQTYDEYDTTQCVSLLKSIEEINSKSNISKIILKNSRCVNKYECSYDEQTKKVNHTFY